ATDVDAGVAAAMAELDRGFGAAAMDLADQSREAGEEAVVVDAELAFAVTAGARRRGHLDRDHADAAAHPCHVVGDRGIGDVALLVGEPRRHRWHDDAVGELDRADPAGNEERIGESAHRSRITSPSPRRRPCRWWRRAASGRAATP